MEISKCKTTSTCRKACGDNSLAAVAFVYFFYDSVVFFLQMLRTRELPLGERVFRSSSLSVPLVSTIRRPDKYKCWTSDHMSKALDAVSLQGLTVRRAAEQYGVPKSTLHDRVSGRVMAGACSGPPKYLTEEEEDELEQFLAGCASIGYGKSRQQVIQLVQEVVTCKGMHVTVTHGWWESFRRRHPDLTLRIPAALSNARALASNPNTLSRYFDLLKQTLVDNGLLDKPAQIFNIDETGMPLDPSPPQVIAVRGQKNPSAIGSGDKSQITVLSCCSAAGYVLPPFVIFDRKSLKPELTIGEVPGTVYGLSKKGWIDAELFELWFTRHFLPHAPPLRPLLFLLDGHSSHYQPDVIQRAAEEQVIMFCLPPHTTHLTQPLDKGCFAPLKMHWREECWSYITRNPGQVVTRYQFSELFSRAWMKGMTMQNIIAGFRTTGVFPFDPSVILAPKKPKRRPSLAERTGLQFIPLYSPSSRKLDTTAVANFSPNEIARFQVRFEEGYDIPDQRYEQWLQMYHPQDSLPPDLCTPPVEPDASVNLSLSTTSSCEDCCQSLPRSSDLAKLLADQAPTVKYPQPQELSYSSRVLTSSENLLKIQEKEKKKQEEAEEKQRKKLEREQKRLAKEEEKQRKALERERKRLEKESKSKNRGKQLSAQPTGLC